MFSHISSASLSFTSIAQALEAGLRHGSETFGQRDSAKEARSFDAARYRDIVHSVWWARLVLS